MLSLILSWSIVHWYGCVIVALIIGNWEAPRLRIIYNDKQSSCKELLEKDSSVSIHERNVHMSAAEMRKVSSNFSPPHMNEIFQIRNEHTYNLRQNSQFFQALIKSVHHGT